MNVNQLSSFQQIVGNVISFKTAFKIVWPVLVASLIVVASSVTHGQPGAAPMTEKPKGFPNLAVQTGGGMQFWTDLRNVSGWKIQQNSETGHCRLIDSTQVRQAWGNFAHCEQALQQRIQTGQVVQPAGKVVILLHGLVRTRNSMQVMERHLQGQGFTTVNFGYASSRKQVNEHAVALKSVIDGLGDQVTDVYLVAHSLGNIVIRKYLHDTTNPQTNRNGDPRIRRIVMLGPPNQGSKAARLFKNSYLFQTIAGESGDQLASGWAKLSKQLATPTAEFGIIAGGQQNENYSNFLLEGKDDYTVSVEETKLVGASDFLMHPLLHGTMMNQPIVLEATNRFFNEGCFVAAEKRIPLR